MSETPLVLILSFFKEMLNILLHNINFMLPHFIFSTSTFTAGFSNKKYEEKN